MPVPTEYKYYPALSGLITVDSLPDYLSFIRDGLEAIFDKIYYQNYQTSKSISGSSAFYSLDIVSRTKLAFELPGTEIFFVLNPDYESNNVSSFPVSLFWEWELMRYIRNFKLEEFSFSPGDLFNLAFDILEIAEEQALQLATEIFVVQSNPALSKFNQLVQDINDLFSALITIDENASNRYASLLDELDLLEQDVISALFTLYILAANPEDTKANVNRFFAAFIPNDIEEYIRKIITPKARVTLLLRAAIEFPKKYLKPVDEQGADILPASTLTRFEFAEALLYADTETGIGYEIELSGSLNPPYAAIGNTGLILRIESLKIDLSRTSNIAEANADGRGNDFVGVYAKAISITLPPKWFHDDTEPIGAVSTTLRLGGYDMLIGTGGVSGTIILETVPVVNGGQITYYFEDKFTLDYPVVLFQQNADAEIVEINIANVTDLKTLLYPATATGDMPVYSLKFPLSLTTSGGEEKTFTNSAEYQLFLAEVSDNKALWKKIGGDNGFRVGFTSFDINFKQNKITQSNIRGALEINKFVYPEGTPNAGEIVRINIEGSLSDNGDFNLTASAEPPFPIELPDVFIYNLKSAEFGRQDDDFYIGTSGSIQFQGFLKDVLHIGPIEVERLRIFSDGSIELEGGSIGLVKPIVLPLGPVEITVSAIRFGSHQSEYDGVMRKFNYFGFDGGMSVDPLGIEIRGNGVKFYFCVDNLPDKPSPYLHIQTLYLDLTIPAKSPVAIINGWLTIPEPGVSAEYAGGIKLQIPKAKIAGSADMKLAPKYPAFIINAEIELPAPIPLGAFSIYGFRGLLGYRYVAEKEAIGLVSGVDSWYDYYKAPRRGINVEKFSKPDQTKLSGTPVSLGAGASLGTSFDNGTVLNIKAMVLLSIPSLFMIDGRAAIISARFGLEDTGEPPFFAFIAVGDNSLEFGLGADFKMPTKTGDIVTVNANIQAGFFFNDSSKWYVNVGTKTDPITARVLTLFTFKSYLMLSAKGIEAGARGEFNFEKSFSIIHVHAWVFIEVGGKISFERAQFGAYLNAEVGADIDIKFISLYLCAGVAFTVEAPKPFLITGKMYYEVHISIFWVFSFDFAGDLEIKWEFNTYVDTDPVNPMVNSDNIGSIQEMVKGVSMRSAEIFPLAYLGDGPMPTTLEDSILHCILPLDTYIDIKTEKGLNPEAISDVIGGYGIPAKRNWDMVPPDSTANGQPIRQVKHEYSIKSLDIKSWNPTTASWDSYNPYKALYPDDGTLDSIKAGQFQATDGQYSNIRLLGTTPFDYTEEGEPGWHTPEQYGINATTLFCEGQQIGNKCASFLTKTLGQKYYCYDPNQQFFSNDVAFLLLNSESEDFAIVTNGSNPFNFIQSLEFTAPDKLQLVLPKDSVKIKLKLTSHLRLRIKYYAAVIGSAGVEYVNPDPAAIDISSPYIVILNPGELTSPVLYEHPDWRPVIKIIIEPFYSETTARYIDNLTESIALIEDDNIRIALGILDGKPKSSAGLDKLLHELSCSGGSAETKGYQVDPVKNLYTLYSENETRNAVKSWDYKKETKYPENEIGFGFSSVLVIAGDSELLEVKLLGLTDLGSDARKGKMIPANDYKVVYDGKNASIFMLDLDESVKKGYLFNVEVTTYKKGNECGKEDKKICKLYSVLLKIYDSCMTIKRLGELEKQEECGRELLKLFHDFNEGSPDYKLEVNLKEEVTAVVKFIDTPRFDTYDNARNAIKKILDYLDKSGNCHCECAKDKKDSILLHEVCWLSWEVYQYNINIPSQEAIAEDSQATIDGITKYIQPIWRPDTNYFINFVLNDRVYGIGDAVGTPYDFSFSYGFTTAGPVGYFHTHPDVHYVEDGHPEKYALTSLRQYIDYKRSYPNADGNLLSAKPLFYDDETTQIYLFFNESYTTHFFREWQAYNGKSAIKGRIKIVIKDPREDISIVNPPYLDYDPADTVHVTIPQTIETWNPDEDPQVPFVISQYLNLYNASQCTDTVEIIKPASEYISVIPKHLKPNKLYTAIVNNLYDMSGDNEFDSNADIVAGRASETREVHRFVFKTSRYKDFEEQVGSFLLVSEANGERVERSAIFKIKKSFTPEEIAAAYNIITNQPLTGLPAAAIDNLNNNYQDAYDRVFEGVLGLSPLDDAISTEVNLVCNDADNKIIAIMIRNPEPFNNPGIPVADIMDTIQVLTGSMADTSYKIVLAKDYSKAIIMHESMEISTNLDLQLRYKIWDGTAYVFPTSVIINIMVLNP